jgi:hypothetical protein
VFEFGSHQFAPTSIGEGKDNFIRHIEIGPYTPYYITGYSPLPVIERVDVQSYRFASIFNNEKTGALKAYFRRPSLKINHI